MAAGGLCQDCFKGTLRGDAQPTGTLETIHGLPTYVARPGRDAQPLGVVVIIPDIFGWELVNSRALADAYARRGPFTVYLPDFMNGAAPPAHSLALVEQLGTRDPSWWKGLFLKPWLFVQLAAIFVPTLIRVRPAATSPGVRAFFQALRASDPALKVGAAGFCWGGRHTIDLCGDESGLLDCGFTAHPSMVKIPDALHKVRAPLSVANGDNDAFMGRAKMATLTEVLEAVAGEDGAKMHEVVVYPGAKHGFGVRGDPKDPRQAEHGLGAEDQAVAWFRKHFSS